MRSAFVAALLLLCELAHAGYDLHITRKAHWADTDGPTISIAEWRAYVKRDFQVARDSNSTELDFVVSISGESFPIWFDPKLGELVTKNPSERAVVKLIEIAKALRARLQGDDGEFYPSERPNQSLEPNAANAARRGSRHLRTSPPNSH